jgi:hypothetical protein
MTNYDFWNEWDNVTDRERHAIDGIIGARKLILENIPNDDIVSIYVNGSFVRRDLNLESDVDTQTIVRDPKYLDVLRDLDKKYREPGMVHIDIAGYSINELLSGQREKNKLSRTPPVRFVKHLEHYKPIFGETLNPEEYFTRSDRDLLRGLRDFVEQDFLPLYEKGLPFSHIVKQVFWLAEGEARVNGEVPPYSWEGVKSLFDDKEHIIHQTYEFRQDMPTDDRVKTTYIEKLKKYLKNLEKI